MNERVYIDKASGREEWSRDHAVGTMLLSGVDAASAIKAVEIAEELFREFKVAALTSSDWTLLSEEIRRGNIGAATLIVKTLPKSLVGLGGTFFLDEDGDHANDIPPPIIYGEIVELDQNMPPVYVVSDFHLGSSMKFPKTDKRDSNDMSHRTLDKFLEWMKSVDADAASFDHYDIVMNGDFLDLWQAKRPHDDSDGNRLNDILSTNSLFLEDLGKYLRSKYPRCRFYYLVGNHDDALYSSGDGSHYQARKDVALKLRQETKKVLLPGYGRVDQTTVNQKAMSLTIQTQYRNSQYQLLIRHGHQHDGFNMKDGDDDAVGKSIAEHINHMQESDEAFQHLEFTPNRETVKYLACLKGHDKTPKRIKDLIEDMQKKAVNAALSDSFFGAIGDGIDYLMNGDRSVLRHEHVDPRKVRESNAKVAKEIINDADQRPRVKIVVFGHTHLRDLQPNKQDSSWAYANSGTWMDEIQFGKDASGCSLKSKPSPLPYIKIAKEGGQDKAIVELKFYRGNLAHRAVRVRL